VRTLASGGGDDTVLLIPTANPDGVGGRHPCQLERRRRQPHPPTLSTAESRAIASVLAEYRPDVLNDLHEYRTEGARRVLTRGDSSYGGLVSAAIRRLSVELTHRWQERAIQAGGYATAPFSDAVAPRRTRRERRREARRRRASPRPRGAGRLGPKAARRRAAPLDRRDPADAPRARLRPRRRDSPRRPPLTSSQNDQPGTIP
jgi:hypothetical protein